MVVGIEKKQPRKCDPKSFMFLPSGISGNRIRLNSGRRIEMSSRSEYVGGRSAGQRMQSSFQEGNSWFGSLSEIKMFYMQNSEDAIWREITAFLKARTDFTDNYYADRGSLTLPERKLENPRHYLASLENEMNCYSKSLCVKSGTRLNKSSLNRPFLKTIRPSTKLL